MVRRGSRRSVPWAVIRRRCDRPQWR